MSLLHEAFPPGRPLPPARSGVPLLPAVTLVCVLALVVVLLPLAGSAEARRRPHAKKATPAVAKVVGRPPRSFVPAATSYFSFPNRSKAERDAIYRRVLLTINSTWGGRRTRIGTPLRTNGTIRIATWSFDDWKLARALVAAKRRGVSVQVVAAKAANRDHDAWRWLRRKLGSRLYVPGRRTTRDSVSFARQCQGSCRGPGGTPHSKFFLFDNVGRTHARNITFQTSMNLTEKAHRGQWNQAQVMRSSAVYADFLTVFRQMRIGRVLADPYVVKARGTVVNYFFPRPRATSAEDPVMHLLNGITCRGATSGTAGGRTRIRVAQYAIYGERGVWIAKKLRLLWKAGCDIAIVYAVSSRPVLSVLRDKSGRGPVPMRQSVVKDSSGVIWRYNHSKWMTVQGWWGRYRGANEVFTGSANWADIAFGDDEQMQRISSRRETIRYNTAFAKTWRQRTSRPPAFGRVLRFGRFAAPLPDGPDVPRDTPAFGRGVFRHMTED